MPVATADLQPGELMGFPGGGRWKATSPGHFQRDDAMRLSWVVAIHRRAAQLHSLPEYRECIDLIQANEAWRDQFGTLVGTHWGRMRLDVDWFLDGCLGEALTAGVEGRDAGAAAAER